MESREIPIDLSNEDNCAKLKISQNLDLGYAGEVWDAALVYEYFLLNKTKSSKLITYSNKTVLELGAGTGVLGLTFGLLGASKIILNDKGGCTSLLSKNYENNKTLLPS